MRCGLTPADCITNDWLEHLPGTTGRNGQYKARCPVCKKRCMSLTAGRTTVLYRCHRKPRGCSQLDLRAALTEAGITCLPSRSHRKPPGDQFRSEVQQLLAEPMSPAVFRFRIAMAAWECDAWTAAAKLGLPERTARRLMTGRLFTRPFLAGNRRSDLQDHRPFLAGSSPFNYLLSAARNGR